MGDLISKKEIDALNRAQDLEVENFVLKIKSKIEKQLIQTFNSINKKKSIDLDTLITELSKLSTLNLPKDLQAEIDGLANLYTSRLKEVSKGIKEVNKLTQNIFNKSDEVFINQMLEFGKVNIISNINQTYNEFRETMYQGSIAKTLPTADAVIERLSLKIEGRLDTEVNTQLAGFQRTAQVKKSEDLGLTHFLYAGGLIKTSRQFCIERADKIYTFEEAKNWDNGQGLEALVYLGGYNCRHRIVPMTKDLAVEEGWKE